MSEIKSPLLVPPPGCCDDIYPVDYANMQRKVVLRAARIKPVSRKALLWGMLVDIALWALILMGGRWIYLLLR